jgi:hypothetical protein
VYQTIEVENPSPTSTERLLQYTPHGRNPADEIAHAFSSFRRNIIQSTDTKAIVSQLIESEQAEAIAFKDGQLFIIRLEKMIKLATESST